MPSIKYFGCRFSQRADPNCVRFFYCHVRVKELRTWAGIRRIEEDPEGTQRLLRRTRTQAVGRFLRASSINTIPPSVLLAFDPGRATFTPAESIMAQMGTELVSNGYGGEVSWGCLGFEVEDGAPEHAKPALIVDGQHRIFGMANFEEDLPVLAVCLLDAAPIEQAFQYIVINNKAVAVPQTDVKSILASFHQQAEDNLRDRLLASGVSYKDFSPVLKEINDLPESPFRNLLDWAYNQQGPRIVPLTGIEQSLRFIKSLFAVLETDEDSLVGLFCAMWRGVRASLDVLWVENSKFLTKVNIAALSEYLGQRLKISWEFGMVDLFDPEDVERQTAKLMEPMRIRFWQAEWSITIQDNANVRQLIKDDLETMAANHRAGKTWSDGLVVPIVTDQAV